MARVLIAGCGDIGAAVGKVLVDAGHEVYGLKRRPPDEKQGIRYIKADLSKPGDMEAIDTNFDLVIYILTPDDRSEYAYRKAFVVGLDNLLTVVSQNNPDTRLIFVSSTSVYGQSSGEWVDEGSLTRPAKINGQILLQAEHSVLSWSRNNCIIRFSGIYGRGHSHLLDAVARGGDIQYEPPYYMNRIHREDCIRVICLISNKMISGEQMEPIYLASDDDPAPKWEVFDYLSGKLGAPRPGKAILSHDSDQNKRCRNIRLKQLGYEFKYTSYRQGFDSAG